MHTVRTVAAYAMRAAVLRCWLPLLVLAATGHAPAQQLTQYQDDAKLFRGQMQPTALGPALFGDQVGTYTGGLQFVQQDVSLPGNDLLSVAVGRRYVAGVPKQPGWHFADWDLEIPRIQVTVAKRAGWRLDLDPADRTKRCTHLGAPELSSAMTNGSTYMPGEPIVDIHVPGEGQSAILVNRTPPHAPTDGFQYHLVTRSGWRIRCLSQLAGGTDAQGEGFLARSPDGVTYRFDWMIQRPAKTLLVPEIGAARMPRRTYLPADPQRGLPARVVVASTVGASVAGGRLWPVERVEVWLVPTAVTDRFGNTVRYDYDPATPARLRSIEASDGRRLSFGYAAAGALISSVSDGVRTWRYEYSPAGDTLAAVVLPDNTRWQFSGDNLQLPVSNPLANGDCDSSPSVWAPPPNPKTRTLVHPSGAVGQFTVQQVAHARTGVPCPYPGAVLQFTFNGWSLVAKTLTGPGIPSGTTWTTSYPSPTPSFVNCTTCAEGKSVLVTDPRGYTMRHLYGTRYMVDEGLLLQLDEGWNGAGAVRATHYRYRPFGVHGLSSSNLRGDDEMATRILPQDRRAIRQQDRDFVWEATEFDARARPSIVVRSGPSGTKSERTTYFDHDASWTQGQVQSVTDLGTGLVIESTEYDARTATPRAKASFGRTKARFDYHPDGNVQYAYDEGGRRTSYANYKRGIARNIGHPDGTGESAEVDDLGYITAVTNAAGTTHRYGYDSMGRLARVTPPGGDPVAYHDTLITFAPVGAEEYGLAPGHWRQTVVTGSAITHNHFDALWRLRLSRTWDTQREPDTVRMVQTRYDADGRKQFESYPLRSIASITAAVPGTGWAHDALGRVFLQSQDSEQGVLATRTEYLDGFQRRVTNARQQQTTYAFQAYDQPTEDAIASIAAPEGVSVVIDRDTFGKARSITRAGGGTSVTRGYGYDVYQRLCKTVEPESGATIQDYDVAGNVEWRASGLSLPGGYCDRDAVPAWRKVSHAYDARNRLRETTYGDGARPVVRTYTPDGQLQTLQSNGQTWTYQYNNRRLLTAEWFSLSSQAPGNGWNFTYGIDAYGHVSSLSDPMGTMNYRPDALGQPSEVSGYASSIQHHANGSVAGYTLANGITHTATLNARQLPELWRDAGPAGLVVQDRYAYDPNGNVTAITDEQDSRYSRSMPWYDGLDRLRQAQGIWGTARYDYDALDNLVYSQVGTRSLNHQINPATNRLDRLSGSQAVEIAYDDNGNVRQRGAQAFAFDVGNRLWAAPGKAVHSYDGHGRRNWTGSADGSSQLFAYSKGGKLLWDWHSARNETRHVYLGDKLIAETNRVTGTSYVSTDALGSPVARTDGGGNVSNRTRYEPYGGTAGGTNPVGIGFTGHVNDGDTGLVYMQQRYYDPIAGRFLSVDPVVTDARAGGHFNRYTYADNDPYGRVDPDGRAPIAPRHPDPVLQRAQGVGNAINTIARIAAPKALTQAQPSTQAKTQTGDSAAKGDDKVVFRLGEDKESASRLARKSGESEQAGFPHGVSTSTTKPPAGTACSSASCAALEAAGMKVHPTPTRNDPNHHTVELPKPVTPETARAFNEAFGRGK